MKISFCTTCMGRLPHLKETFQKNLSDNAGHPDLEFVLLDYNSKDGTEEWARSALKDEIASGRVVYYKETASQHYDSSHAKNLAHGLSTGEVICNLDADNYTGTEYVARIMDEFAGGKRAIMASGRNMWGLTGRIAIRREDFDLLRGYDEAFSGYGEDDADFWRRAAKFGLPFVSGEAPGSVALAHPDAVRMENMPDPKASTRETINFNLSIIQSRKPGSLVNPNGFGRATVFRNFSATPCSVGWGTEAPTRGFALRSTEESVKRALLVDGWMSPRELDWLARMALSHHTIVEIGSWKGRSTKAMGGATLGVVYAVDHYKGADAHANSVVYGEAVKLGPEKFSEIFKANLSDEIAAGRVVQIVSDGVGAVEVVASMLRGVRPDMVFIDAGHSYEAVKRDIEAWRPLLAPGGILSGHDYWDRNPDVKRAVDEIVPGFKRIADSIWFLEMPK